jgi:YesN/AraC family two-component response regulator
VVSSEVPFQLAKLKQAIEHAYKSHHAASYYAEMLHISTNALTKLVKNHFHKTLTELITERIITEAKRELYLTNKPVKEIAWDLGYKDEYYFSRVFKNYTDVAPAVFRETVGYGKAEEVF